jgi:hypothetical protein
MYIYVYTRPRASSPRGNALMLGRRPLVPVTLGFYSILRAAQPHDPKSLRSVFPCFFSIMFLNLFFCSKIDPRSQNEPNRHQNDPKPFPNDSQNGPKNGLGGHFLKTLKKWFGLRRRVRIAHRHLQEPPLCGAKGLSKTDLGRRPYKITPKSYKSHPNSSFYSHMVHFGAQNASPGGYNEPTFLVLFRL